MDQEITKLKNQYEESERLVKRQQQAFELIKADQQEKDNEIENLIDKRIDVQQELKSRNFQSKEVNEQMKELLEERKLYEIEEKKQEKAREQLKKREEEDKYANADQNQESSNQKLQNLGSVTSRFQKSQNEANMMFEQKSGDLKEMAIDALKKETKSKYKEIKEDSGGILKRISAYHHLMNQDGPGLPHCKAVNVKIFEFYFNQSQEHDDVDQGQKTAFDDGRSVNYNQSEVSRKSKKSMKSMVQNKEDMKKKEMQDKQLEAQREDPTSSKWKYKLYEETFRISKLTDLKTFKKNVCEYWGIDPEKFSDFYDENGDKIELDHMGGSNPSISKIIESVEKNEIKHKELQPPGPRRAVIYIGDKSKFQVEYEQMIKLQLKKLQEVRHIQKLREKESANNEDDPTINDENQENDKEEIFLKKFPGFPSHYRRNKEIFRKQGNKPGFDIRYGDWMPPSCCSLFVNVIQFILTFASIYMYKGDPQGFWIPQLIRNDLEAEFRGIQDMSQFWKFTQDTLGDYVFEDVSLMEGFNLNLDYLNTFNETLISDNSRGRMQVGKMRILLKRVAQKPCKRNSEVERYGNYFQKCYWQNFDETTEDTEDFNSDYSWGQYFVDNQMIQISPRIAGQNYNGHFGNYKANYGFMQDFSPYETTTSEYKEKIQEMRQGQFTEGGATKAVIINFNYLYPSSEYFVSVIMMFEFSGVGQVIPTRFDASPFRMSGFAKNNNSKSVQYVDGLKFVLVVYTAYAVIQIFSTYKTIEQIFRFSNITDNFIDLGIIYLQTYCFAIKIISAELYDVDPKTLDELSNRQRFFPIYFLAKDYRTFSTMETIGLFLVLFKVIDGLRYIQRINVIIMTLSYSKDIMFIWIGLLVVFNMSMVPLAQAVWGTYLIGYKSFFDAFNSVCMIAYSKGNLEQILEINFIWSSLFMLLYYTMAIFIFHAAFHMTQTDALKNIVLLNSLQETDVVQPPKVKVENEEEFKRQQQKDLVAQSVRALKWFFGWLPNNTLSTLDKINDILIGDDPMEDDEEKDQTMMPLALSPR